MDNGTSVLFETLPEEELIEHVTYVCFGNYGISLMIYLEYLLRCSPSAGHWKGRMYRHMDPIIYAGGGSWHIEELFNNHLKDSMYIFCYDSGTGVRHLFYELEDPVRG